MIVRFILVLILCTIARADGPNVILVMADDLGYGDLGCYGQSVIQTPHIDRLAAGGVRLTRGYAGSTVCAPSRAVLMTGKHTGHVAIRGNRRIPLPAEEITIAEVLRDGGYRTALIGKWGLGEPGTEGEPNAQGFDHFFGYTDQRHAHNYYPAFLWRNRQRVQLDNVVPGDGPFGRGWAEKKAQYSHDLFIDEATSWVGDALEQDASFFLYLALTIPHANNEAKRGTGNGQEVPDFGPYADEDWPDQDKGQAAMITRMDDGMGRLVALLEQAGALEDTVIIFTSDNGHHDEGGYDTSRFDPNGPLRGMKRDLYEGGVRVPFIVSWPGHIPAGSLCNEPVTFWDVLPTLAEVAGIDDSMVGGRAERDRRRESAGHVVRAR